MFPEQVPEISNQSHTAAHAVNLLPMSFLTKLAEKWFSNPEELVTQTCKSASLLCTAARLKRASSTTINVDGVEKDVEEAIETARVTIGKQLGEMKLILMGDQEKEVDEDRAKKLADAALANNLARSLAACVIELPLESCKNAAHVFSNLIRRDKSFAAHVVKDGYVLEALARAYPENAEVALACGMMLKEAARHDIVAAALLKSPSFWLFLTDYVNLKDFDVSADSFDLVRVLLTRHKTLAAKFILENYDFFFECFHHLLQSKNYVTCRESLRLLSDILLDRSNYATMMRYIAQSDNLKIFMLLLRSKKLRIQLEAFHVFKVFVANPKKHPTITKVLYQNKEKLLAFLQDFHNDKSDDQFIEERQLILDTLTALDPPPPDDSQAWNDAANAALAKSSPATTPAADTNGTPSSKEPPTPSTAT